jgi:hypothetical protein
MIRIRVRNFRGCAAADIDLDPVALVAGRNAAGKSSVAQAAAAALVGDPTIAGLATKGRASLLVHDGAAAGSVEIEDPAGRVRVLWPEAAASATGIAPQASAYAAGMMSLAELAPRDRGAVLAQCLEAAPDRDDVSAALAAAGLGEETIVAAVWQLLEDRGWDHALQLRRDKGAELKGQWRQVTGQSWGSRVAASWLPADWTSDLDDMTAERLAAESEAASRSHDEAVGTRAVSEAQRQHWAAEAASLDERRDLLRDAEAAAEHTNTELEQAQAARAALPVGGTGAPMPCPHCGALVDLVKVNLVESRLVVAEAISPADLKARRLQIAEADGAVSRLAAELGRADRAVEAARARMQQASEASHRLAQLPAGPAAAADTAAAKDAVDRARARERAWHQRNEAADLSGKIASNEVLLKILAGDGLRAEKLGRVLAAFNGGPLAELAAAAEWPAVAVEPDMTVTLGGRPYLLLSSSEQYRARIVLQVAMAGRDGSSMVVIDAADLLDAPSRSGLMALLDRAQMPALVCMTASRKDQVPDLARAGLGRSYWLDAGAAQPIGELAEAAA